MNRETLEDSTKQMAFQATHGHVFIDQKPLITISTVSYKRDYIFMLKQTEHRYFSYEFFVALEAIPVELFDGYDLTHNKKLMSNQSCRM